MTTLPATDASRVPARESSRVLAVTRLHFVRRLGLLVVPLIITVVVVLVTIVIQIAIQRAMAATPEDFAPGARMNPAVAWAQSGYFIALGVSTVATAFPLAASLGTTRRDFALGTTLAHLLASLYITAVFVALLGIELVTDHWFGGFYVFDVDLLGAGDPVRFVATVFVGSLLCFSIGSVFGASWLRFGPRGPLAISLGTALVLAGGVLLAVPSFGAHAEAFRPWWVAVAAVALIALSIGGTFAFLRRASAR
jgi:hypothetical protein